MSGLSSLSGAPSPLRRSNADSGEKTGSKGEQGASLSSLSTAPPLGARQGIQEPATTGSKTANPLRISAPLANTSKDEDEELFPKSRGLLKKDATRQSAPSKAASKSTEEYSDDDLPLPMSSSAAMPGSNKNGTQNSGSRPASKAAVPGAASSTNPILAMLENEDDDELLKGLAPPSSKPTPSPAAVTTSLPSKIQKPAAAVAASKPNPSSTNKSMDALLSFLKHDDEILSKPLPKVEEDPLELPGMDAKPDRSSATQPRQGRRAAASSPLDDPPPPAMKTDIGGSGNQSIAMRNTRAETSSQDGLTTDTMSRSTGSGNASLFPASKQAAAVPVSTLSSPMGYLQDTAPVTATAVRAAPSSTTAMPTSMPTITEPPPAAMQAPLSSPAMQPLSKATVNTSAGSRQDRPADARTARMSDHDNQDDNSYVPSFSSVNRSAPNPLGKTGGFRLPSEKRAMDVFPIQNPTVGSGSRPETAPAQTGGHTSKSRSALQALDASSDEDVMGPPLHNTQSPAQSMHAAAGQLGTRGNNAAQQDTTRRGAVQVAASVPDASFFAQHQKANIPAHQQAVPQLHHQLSAPAVQEHAQQPHTLQGYPTATQALPAPAMNSVTMQPNTSSIPATNSTVFAGSLPPGVVAIPVSGPPPGVIPINMSAASGTTPASFVAGPTPAGITLYPTAAAVAQQQQRQAGLQQAGQAGLPQQLQPTITQVAPLTAVPQLPVALQQQLPGNVQHPLAAAALEQSRAELAQLKESNEDLKKQVSELEAALKAKDQQARDAENRVSSLEARSKLTLAEAQALSLKEAAGLRSEVEDMKAALARVKASYAELEQDRAREIARLKTEMDEARQAAAAEMAALKEDIAGLVVAAEARGRRAGLIEKEVAEAQLKAQQAALEEEKEVVHRHRLSAEVLAQLTEKVRAAAASTVEREERALRALERDVFDRENRLASRERMLTDREDKLVAREKELDALRQDLTNLSRTLETASVQEKEELRREQARLARESIRLEALQGSVISDKEDLKVQLVMERKLLEDAREARRKEREALLNEVAADRKALATEHADAQRQLDGCRAELLQLKSKVVEYEARAAAALQQALTEEQRLRDAKQQTESEMASAAAVRTKLQDDRSALEIEANSLVEFARRLQEQSTEVADNHAALERLKVELAASRQEVSQALSDVRAKELDVEERSKQVEAAKKALDRERLSMATERRTLNDDRLAASKAAGQARDAQMRLADAVRQWVAQGVPIPFSVEASHPGATTLSVKPYVPGSQPLPSASPSKDVLAAGRRQRDQQPGRNSLKHMLSKLGLELQEADAAAGKTPAALVGSHADYILQQKQFLTQLRMSVPSAGILPQSYTFPAVNPVGLPTPGLTTATQPAMQQQFQPVQPYSHTRRGALFPPDSNIQDQAALGVNHVNTVQSQPHTLLTAQPLELSERAGTGLSSDFTPMAMVSATTSEHEGHSGSEGGREGASFGVNMGEQLGGVFPIIPEGSCTEGEQTSQGVVEDTGSSAPGGAAAWEPEPGNGDTTTPDLKDTAMSPFKPRSQLVPGVG